jgi:hypothetical protein
MAMEVSALAASGQRLLEALEASRAPAGQGLISNGPSPVPKELADAFSRLMEAGPVSDSASVQGVQQVRADGIAPVDQLQVGVTPIEAAGPITADTELTPEKLLKLQFEIGGLVMKERFGLAANTGVIQNFEQTLKAQG